MYETSKSRFFLLYALNNETRQILVMLGNYSFCSEKIYFLFKYALKILIPLVQPNPMHLIHTAHTLALHTFS